MAGIEKVVMWMNQQYEKKQRLKFSMIDVFLVLVIGLILAYFLSFRSYQNMGILTIIPFDSLFFLNVGIILLGISCRIPLYLFHFDGRTAFADDTIGSNGFCLWAMEFAWYDGIVPSAFFACCGKYFFSGN